MKINNQNKGKYLILIFISFMITGCAGLPSHGPSAIDVTLINENQTNSSVLSNQANYRYQLINLDADAIHKLTQIVPIELMDIFPDKFVKSKSIRLGVGDQLLIHIWEASSDGLFSTVEKKYTTIESIIDDEGKIFIPYVGRAFIAGNTVEQVRKKIEIGLAKKAIEPQVSVAVVNNLSNRVTVLGDVNNSGQFNIPANGLLLSQAIAQAGGIKAAVFDTELTIVRDNKRHSIRLDQVLNNNRNDIYLNTQDIIIVNHLPKTFTAFGAVNTNNYVKFSSEKLYLTEGLAQVGGLNDRLADAGGVFLFRFEPVSSLDDLVGDGQQLTTMYEKGIATIYRLNFKHPDAFFLASAFEMKDKDIIYVANAPIAEFNKFISMIVAPILSGARVITDFN